MYYGYVVVQQPLSASSVIYAACVSVAVMHICNKFVDSAARLQSVAMGQILRSTERISSVFRFHPLVTKSIV